jgi:non-ribosomal peptide synthetase component F
LKKAYPYSSFVSWLETKNNTITLQYWKDYLAGYAIPCGIPKNRPGVKTDRSIIKKGFPLENSSRQIMRQLCVELGITENTFIQAAWGILLSRYNNTNDVVFGTVVSGRPAELEGVEEMPGLFINTVPVRIKTPKGMTLPELFRETQDDFIKGNGYHYAQLAEVQLQSEPGRNLFDHILIFENYPVQEEIAQFFRDSDAEEGPVLLSTEIDDHTNYDFLVIIIPGEKFIIQFAINTGVYDESLIDTLQYQFLHTIGQMLKEPRQVIEDIRVPGLQTREVTLANNQPSFFGEPMSTEF